MYGRLTLKAVNLVSTMTANGYNLSPLPSPSSLSQKELLKAKIVGAGLDFQDTFSLATVYGLCLDDFKKIWPNNNNMKASIRATLQTLRNEGFIDFLGNGVYTMHVEEEQVQPPRPRHITKDYEPCRCEARIMCIDPKDGYYRRNNCLYIPDNIRCGHMKRDGERYCLKHTNAHTLGRLWLGSVTEERPDLNIPENQPSHLKKPNNQMYRWCH